MKKLFKYGGLFVLVLLLLINSTLLGQSSTRQLRFGDIQVTPGETISAMSMQYPQTWNNNLDSDAREVSSVNGINVGVKMSWTDGNGVPWEHKIAQGIQSKFTEIENVIVPVSGAFKRVFKYAPPIRMIDGRDWTDAQYKTDPVDESIPADGMVYGKWNTWTGIDVERWVYACANQEYDDFVVYEWVFENASNEAKTDVYFSIVTEMMTGDHYPGNLWSDYYGAGYASGQDSLRLYYMWEADEPEIPEDDKANPDLIWGNFEKPQYMGMQVLHADKSTTDDTDDPAQPHKAGWSQRELLPSLSEATHDEIYEFMSGPWNTANPSLQTDESGMYRSLIGSWVAHVSNPVEEQAKPGSFHFGPYQMAPGEDVRIVVAYIGGSINHRLAIDAGRAYKAGYSSQLNVEMPYDVMDLGVQGSFLSQVQKDMIIDTGKDSVFKKAGMLKRIWENSDVFRGTGELMVPATPPSPSLTLTSVPDQIEIDWGTEADGFPGLAGYKIYRNYYRPAELAIPTDTTFVLLADVNASTHSYVDTDVIRGQNYWYYVTAYTTDGTESSMLLNRSGQLKSGDNRVDEAVAPTRSPDANWKDNVVVVPNPFNALSRYKYEEDQIKFLNTPAYCNIHIYTMTGDLVQTLYHNEGTGDEEWTRQDTFSSMRIVSGIYLFVVEELDGPQGSPTGETAIGKFVVVK